MKAILFIPLLFACATEDEPVAPEISNLTYNPTSVTVGAQATVSGTLAFTDPDGDLAQLAMEITLPNGTKQMLPMTGLQNVGAMTEGQLVWALSVIPPAAGRYDFQIWILDAAGNLSNKLDGNVTAQ